MLYSAHLLGVQASAETAAQSNMGARSGADLGAEAAAGGRADEARGVKAAVGPPALPPPVTGS